MSTVAEKMAQELRGMKKSGLKGKARELKVSEEDIDAAGDESDEEAALVALILANAPMDPAERLAQELQGMPTKDLKKKARALGIDSEAIKHTFIDAHIH